MHVTPQPRTILEYAMTISPEDANLCLMDPQAFGKKVRAELLTHMPGAATADEAKPTRKPAHRRSRGTGAPKGKAAGAGSGETPAPRPRKPRPSAGEIYSCPQPGCMGKFKGHGWLTAHMKKNHPDTPIPEKKSS